MDDDLTEFHPLRIKNWTFMNEFHYEQTNYVTIFEFHPWALIEEATWPIEWNISVFFFLY
jgi:hypothetical protein